MKLGKRVGQMQELIVMVPVVVVNEFTMYTNHPNIDEMLELKMRQYNNERMS